MEININPFLISNILIVLLYIPIAFLLFTKGKTKAARLFGAYHLCVAFWGLGAIASTTASTEQIAHAYLSITYCSVLFIPVFFHHACSLIINKTRRYFYYFSYGQATLFSALSLSGELFTTKILLNSFYFYKGGAVFLASFILWLFIILNIAVPLVNFYKKSYAENKRDVLFITLGLLSYAGGINNFASAFFEVYPYGNFLVSFHSLLISYAILRHQILNIEIVIRKGLIYYILIASITLLYVVNIVIFERIFQIIFGYKSIATSVITAFIIGLFFVPLKNRIQFIIDKIFFNKSHEETFEENRRLLQEMAKVDQYKNVATLASGIAHEVKNPLTAINTFTEQLHNKLDDKEFLKKFSRIVGKEVGRINDLVHDLLDFAKPSPPQLKPVHIVKLIDDTLEIISNAFIKYNIHVVRDFRIPTNLTAMLDSKQMRQALLNLFMNASEAMANGGTLNVSITLSDSGRLHIAISDTGGGISVNDLPRVFDPFFTTKNSGTGLGLSVTYGIIIQHKGTLRVESQPGKGTTFIIELPL